MRIEFIQGDDQDFVYGMVQLIEAYKGGKRCIKNLDRAVLTEEEQKTVDDMKKMMTSLWHRIIIEMR